MKTTDFNIENQVINYHVNWIGLERISLNGNSVSKKYSFGKQSHPFTLNIKGESQVCRIASNANYSTGIITVQLFINADLTETKKIFLFGCDHNTTDQSSNANNDTFMIGMMFIVLGLCFDWSKFFLFIGLIFLFDSVTRKNITTESCCEQKDKTETKD